METGRRINVLDGWRGVSISLVLIGHFFPNSMINLGTWGVEWFFVLSGRLMAEILFIRRAPLAEFFRRRLSRIYPALLVYVTLTFFVFRNFPDHFKSSAAISALTFTINYASVFVGHQAPIVAHVWSLCIEEHTYVILALIALGSRRLVAKPFLLIATVAAASVCDAFISNLLPHQQFFDVIWRTDAHIYSILFGVLGHLLIKAGIRKEWWFRWIAPIAFLAAVIFQMTSITPSHFVEDCLSTFMLAISVNTIDAAWLPLRKIIEWAPLRELGLMSFSLYLWQQPFFYTSLETTIYHRLSFLALALAIGSASYLAIETPARRALNAIRLRTPNRAV